MDDNRKRLAINLYTDDESQLTALSIIEKKQPRHRADFQRDCLVAGLALSKVDPRLPKILASALSHEITFSTIQHLLNAIKPIEQTTNATAVAWQKRERNTLSPEREWLAWCPINELNYIECLKQSSHDVEVRALWAYSEKKSQIDEEETSGITSYATHLSLNRLEHIPTCENEDSKGTKGISNSLSEKHSTNTTLSAKAMFMPE